MKELLKRLGELERQVDEVIRTTNHNSPEDRIRMIETSQPLMSERHRIEDVLAKQRAGLGHVMQEVLGELRSLADTASQQQICALLDAVGGLPQDMFDSEGFEWDVLRERFNRYQRDHGSKYDYVQALDKIRSVG